MKLAFNKGLPSGGAVLVLVKPAAHEWQRVEFYIKVDNDSVTLSALAGRSSSALLAQSDVAKPARMSEQPTKWKQQGPFESVEQAVAIRNAIAQSLMAQAYQPLEGGLPLWELAHQRYWNQVQKVRMKAGVDTHFKPEDVFLDW